MFFPYSAVITRSGFAVCKTASRQYHKHRPQKTTLFFSSRGQLALPAVFVLFAMTIFVFLLFETTKLSRVKIRNQFALDTAAFVEMANVTDYLNRTAYVNGSFPHRLFKEIIDCSDTANMIPTIRDASRKTCLYDLIVPPGSFPTTKDDVSGNIDTKEIWKFEYAKRKKEFGSSQTVDLNKEYPYFPPQLDFIHYQTAKDYELALSVSKDVWRVYRKVYEMLGVVQQSQKDVYEKLSSSMTFFREGYALNSGMCEPSECGSQGATIMYASRASTDMKRVIKARIAGRDTGYMNILGMKIPYQYPTYVIAEMKGEGLFQLSIVNVQFSQLKTGIEIYQPFEGYGNYFNVDFDMYSPRVHAKIAAQCKKDDNNCIWPYATPKYQVRSYP